MPWTVNTFNFPAKGPWRPVFFKMSHWALNFFNLSEIETTSPGFFNNDAGNRGIAARSFHKRRPEFPTFNLLFNLPAIESSMPGLYKNDTLNFQHF